MSRAEIPKGPASLICGSDALDGVVNFITNIPVPEGVVRGSALANLQSNNNLTAINLNLAGNNHGFNWNVYGTSRSARDYATTSTAACLIRVSKKPTSAATLG